MLRGDNRLISRGKRSRAAGHDDGLTRGVITPHTPGQVGVIERWSRSLKEEHGRAIHAAIARHDAEQHHRS